MGVERRARHGGHAAFLDQPHRERVVVVHAGRLHEVGGVGEDVVGAARLPRDEAGRLDVAPEEVAALLVALAQTDVVRVREPERGDRRLLERMRRADGDEVVGAADTDRELRRRHRVADAPAGDGVGLRDPRDGDRAVGHAGQRRDRRVAVAVVDDVLVDLVGDREQVVLETHLRDRLQLGPREHLAGGIVRAVEHDGLRARRHGAAQAVGIEAEVGRLQRHPHGPGARDDAAGAIVFVKRLEDDDFLARIQDRQQRRQHRLGRAAAHGHVALGIHVHAVELPVLVGDGGSQAGRAPGDGVLVEVAVDGAMRGLEQLPGRREVRHALGEVHAAQLAHHARHLADDGLGEALHALRDADHAITSRSIGSTCTPLSFSHFTPRASVSSPASISSATQP